MQLHFNGSVFDLDEDQTVADVFNFMNNYPKHVNDGTVWMKLVDGSSVHLQVGDSPSFAVVAPRGYNKRGLNASEIVT